MRFKRGYSLIFGTTVTLALVGCGDGSNDGVKDVNTVSMRNAQPSIQQLGPGDSRLLSSVTVVPAPDSATVTIQDFRNNYTIIKDPTSGVVALTNKITGEVKTYNGVELIKFVDLYTSFDIAGPYGQVYRLYQAAFNRKPDLGGLGFWIMANR